ncbi:MAG: tetratricopeptide repeat protein [Bacteroidales bacterium]|nr:tetratricopeptide repeat protein [Bacteroidales bacterium]
MKKILLPFLLFSLLASGMAQTPKNAKVVNSGKLLTEGKALHDEGRFVAAEEKYKEIPIGDSLYTMAQYELGYTYYASEKYEEALAVLQLILDIHDDEVKMPDVYNLTGNTLSGLSRYEEAIRTYEEALRYFPYNYLLYFNKGIVYLKMEDWLNAAACFEEAIFLYPFHQTSHFQLGVSYLNMGLTIQGILAINYAVMLNPGSNAGIHALQYLENVYGTGIGEMFGGNKVDLPETHKLEKNRMNKLENIVKTNVYTQKNFKIVSKVKHSIVYQNQIIFENITPKANAKDIVNFLYIPYFHSIGTSTKDFDTYSIHLFSGTNLDKGKILQLAKKKAAQINDLMYRSVVFLNQSLRKGLGKENKEGFTYVYDNDFFLNHFGKMLENQTEGLIFNGEITFLTRYGCVESRKGYKEGVNNGLNKFYYDDGTIQQEVPIENNKIHGKGVVYFPNLYNTGKPMVSLEINYKRGEIDGDFKRYDPSGVLNEHCVYIKDKLNGKARIFHPQGTLLRRMMMKDGDYDGVVYNFFPNGDTSEIAYYLEDGETGEYKSFYHNGALHTEGSLRNHIWTDAYKVYNSNGKLSFIANYGFSGKKEGAFYEYFPNGNISKECSYMNDKLSGDLNVYTQDGKKRYMEKYQNDELAEVVIYNQDESVNKKIASSNKTISYQIPSIYGFPEFSTTVKYGRKAAAQYVHYWANGSIFREYSEVNKQRDGVFKSYYTNGKLYTYHEYSEGNVNGLYISYYPNDTISEEGYYLNGNKYGAWYSYFINGNVKEVDIYNKNGKILSSNSYKYDGTPHIKQKYLNGMIYEETFFNENGEVFKTDRFDYGNGTRRLYYYNGNPRFEVALKAGADIGKSKSFDFQGNVREDEGQYIEDRYDGFYKEYDPAGFLKSTSEYIMGNRYGQTKIYNIDGLLQMEYFSLNNETHGELKQYYDNGNLYFSANYEYDEIVGIAHSYAADGSLAFQTRSHNHQIVEYAYRDQNGKMTDFMSMPEKVSFTCYYANGKKSMELAFENGMEHGEQRLYYPNGTLHLVKNTHHGNLLGKTEKYYANGKVRSSANYYYDELDGEYKLYYENGTLRCEEYYEGGYPQGEMKFYDNKGKLSKWQKYHYGIVVDEVRY